MTENNSGDKARASSNPPVKKTSKFIGGKTMEEREKERSEMLELYKQKKQKVLEKQKTNKKPHFWLGVAKAESKGLLRPSASHSGVSSISKNNLVSRGTDASSIRGSSTRKVASKEALRSLKQLSSCSSNDAAMAGTSSQGSFTRISSKNINRGSGKTGIKPGHSFAPEGYKISAPSGLENLPRVKRPSIRFSATPPSVTPPPTGSRRMPRSKTPKPSNCEVPLEDDLVAEATVLPNTHSSSNSPANSDSTVHTPSSTVHTYSISPELLRPTSPLSTDESDTNVWDSILSNSSPALYINEQQENNKQELVTNEAEIEANPQEENGCLKKHKRRSSLREGAVLGAIECRRDSALNSRVSLGLFAPGALESPVMAAAPSGDLISWESPATATSKEDGDVDLMCLNSPQIKADSGQGRSGRVSRLAAAHTSSPASSPASSRRSLRLDNISP